MMIKNRFLTIALSVLTAGALFTGCKSEYATYADAEYIMFSDTLATYPVTQNDPGFDVAVASTVRCDYDRTFGVEIVDKGSTAIENRHYHLASNSITIKAGEGSANVRILADYDKFEPTDSLGVVLRLIVPDQLEWSVYPTQTKVVFMKCCPFEIDEWVSDGGNFILYATFPLSSDGTLVKRLVKAEVMPDGERIRFKSLLGEDFHLIMRFHSENPLNPFVEVLPQRSFFASNYGVILSETDDETPNFFYSCQRFTSFNMVSYSEGVGVFGSYSYILEWITQKQADYYTNNGFGSF